MPIIKCLTVALFVALSLVMAFFIMSLGVMFVDALISFLPDLKPSPSLPHDIIDV